MLAVSRTNSLVVTADLTLWDDRYELKGTPLHTQLTKSSIDSFLFLPHRPCP